MGLQHLNQQVYRIRNLFDRVKASPIAESKYLALKYLNPRAFEAMVSSHKDLLTGLYRETFLRDPDPQGFAHYLSQLNRGLLSVDQIREQLHNHIREQNNHIREQLSNGGGYQALLTEIKTTYNQFLLRQPTDQEISLHLAQFWDKTANPEKARAVIREGNARIHLGIRPLNLEMDITNQCNLRCVMCYFSDPKVYKRKREDLSVDQFTRIAEQIFPLAHRVSLSFSTEPLLHRKFDELLTVLKKYEVPKVYMNTNVLLLNEKTIDHMIRANFHEIGISLDAATKETYERIRVGSKFDRAIANIQAINRAKERLGADIPHITLIFVMMRSNIAELPAFIQLAHALKADSVNAIHMVPYENLNIEHESLARDKTRCNQMLKAAQILADQYQVSFCAPELFPEEVPVRMADEGLVTISEAEPTPTPVQSVTKRFDLNSVTKRFDLNMREGEDEKYFCHFPGTLLASTRSGM